MILVPVEIAFASIIFRDSFFAPEMPRLINLVMFSSMMHQIMFNTFSSMNFAVGQVQVRCPPLPLLLVLLLRAARDCCALLRRTTQTREPRKLAIGVCHGVTLCGRPGHRRGVFA